MPLRGHAIVTREDAALLRARAAILREMRRCRLYCYARVSGAMLMALITMARASAMPQRYASAAARGVLHYFDAALRFLLPLAAIFFAFDAAAIIFAGLRLRFTLLPLFAIFLDMMMTLSFDDFPSLSLR